MLSKIFKSLQLNRSYGLINYKFSQRKSTKNTYTVNDDTYIVHDNEYSFVPKEKIFFKDGITPIFQLKEHRSANIAYFIMMSFFFYLGYLSIKKIYNWNERRWYGVIFYTTLGAFALNRAKRYNHLYKHIAVQLDLFECGKKVRVRSPSSFMGFVDKEYDISKIQRPMNNSEQVAHMSLAFPVLFDKQCYFFFREGQIINKELMPVIMNAKYINTQADSVETEI